ncbi:hypothetical protein AMBLS11_12380 [Alteromonas macleodii str. 'Black Sea 11']|nr:hypothetical protein AMBLS11_12380 [Alteromonas macleodii str. 'Black Sea 11']
MWIFTSKGMVSCVRHRDVPSAILVRARSKDHLLHFVGPELADRYFHLQNCDYQHRAVIQELAFKQRLIEHADEIQYPDFKGSIPKATEYTAYHQACHNVWSVMNDFGNGLYEFDPTVTYSNPADDLSPEDAFDKFYGDIIGSESE